MTVPSDPVLAIDIGGTKIAFANVLGQTIADRLQIATPRSGGGDALVEAIAERVRGSDAKAIAIATTGIVSGGTLTALNPATLPVEDRYPLVAKIEEATGIAPLLVNDAQAAAWGEYRFGAGVGTRSFMFVTVSTGVGGGIVVDGELLTGRNGLAGHVGHMTVPGVLRSCGCGRTGCVETVASGTAISARYSEHAGRKTTAPEVFAAAATGDDIAEQVLDEAAHALAEMFANIIAAVDLDAIATGGGVGLADTFLARVSRHVRSMPRVFQRPVRHATAGADAGMIGVADLAMKKNFII